MKVKNAVTLVFLLFLMIKTGFALGQEDQVLADSTSFVDFLKSQGEIPGLQFRLIDSSNEIVVDTVGKRSTSLGLMSDFTAAFDLKNMLLLSDSIASEIQFLIYEEPNTFGAAQEYVSNLLRNGDLEPVTTDNSNGRDVISLASRD
jgi:hypothetical protein